MTDDNGGSAAAVAPVVPPQRPAAAPVAVAAPAAAAAPASPLIVKTYPAAGITTYTNGVEVIFNGYSTFPSKTVRAWFEYGDSPSFGQATAQQSFVGEKSIGQRALVPVGSKKRYYFRLIAESSGQLVYGETLSFITP